MSMPLPFRIFKRICPHGDWVVAEKLWRQGRMRKLLNYLTVEFQMARGHSFLLGKPYWLTIDPTNFCQLQCPFCPTGAGRGVRDKASMKLDHFKGLMQSLGPTAVHMDMMNWGESVLNKDLPKMIAAAKSYGINTTVHANLNDLTEEMADGLVRAGLDTLSVSIDGVTQKTYETYRIRGKLDRVMENVRLVMRKKSELSSRTPQMVWQFLVFKHNEHEVKRVKEMAQEMGFDETSIVAPFMPNEPQALRAWLADKKEFRLYAAPGETGDQEEAATPENTIHVQEISSVKSFRTRRFREEQLYGWPALRQRLGGPVWKRAWSAFQVVRSRPKDKTAQVPYDRPPAENICKWPWAGMTVNPNGSVAPCCSVEDQGDDFGNIFTNGFGGLWNGSLYRQSRRHVRRYLQGKEPILPGSEHVCERCTAIGYANFKFPASWIVDGDRSESGRKNG